jgi:hypothetical protein
MSPRRNRAATAGITLIEVLIAVTLLSLLSLAMLFALRSGLVAYSKTGNKLMDNRRVAGAQRILEQELEGMIPVVAPCAGSPDAKPTPSPDASWFGFFQGDARTMRLVSSFSLQQAWRGQPQVLEFFVIPGDNGRGVRLVVNEIPYGNAFTAGRLCLGMLPDPITGLPMPHFAPVEAGPNSFVLADKLAYCRFNYEWRSKRPDEPLPFWSVTPPYQGWPAAIRVEMAPLERDPSLLQPITITAALHLQRDPQIRYGDY